MISSWWGISFTTSCAGQTYSGKTAVGIDCREGIVKAARVNAGSFNGYTINASVPSGAKFTDKYPHGVCTGNDVAVRKGAGKSYDKISGYPTLNKDTGSILLIR